VAALFDTAGTLPLAGPDGDARTFHRIDWINPRPNEPVRLLRIVAEPGVRIGVIGATAVR